MISAQDEPISINDDAFFNALRPQTFSGTPMDMTSTPRVGPEILARMLAMRAEVGEPLLVGITGSVAVGKTELARKIAKALTPHLRTDIISTDGFLLPNSQLQEAGLMTRKGFPETINRQLLHDTLERARWGPITVPGYSHSIADVDIRQTRQIERPDILLVEGLGFSPADDGIDVVSTLDSLIYLDASEDDLEHWFLHRFMGLWEAAASDSSSFYQQFRHMSEGEARGFARMKIWREINLPNLHEHIVRARAVADIQLWKERDHSMRLVRPDMPNLG